MIGLDIHGRIFKVLAVSLGLAVAAVLGYLLWPGPTPPPSCGKPGVVRQGPGSECTGVTDGAFHFSPSLAKVSDAIASENTAVARAHRRHVTIALMIPLTSTGAAQRQITEEVQGAFLAQYRANHLSDGAAPLIRLVLANPGSDSSRWRPVADQLARMTGAPDNLRVVAGFDISTQATKSAIHYLTADRHIPVVGGPITGTDLVDDAKGTFPGLARVVPTNKDEAAALAHFNAGVKPRDTVLVEDVRNDDPYIGSLRSAFEGQTRGAQIRPLAYDSSEQSTDALANDFHLKAQDLCQSAPGIGYVYFAGRPVQLRQFVNELGSGTCPRHFTVISGSHASAVTVDPAFDWSALGSRVTLEYASLAYPDAFSAAGSDQAGGSAAAYEPFARLVERFGTGDAAAGPMSLTDSRSIVTYDSVWTAVSGIRTIVLPDGRLPSTTEVANNWRNLRGANRVDGASGWICLDVYGSTIDKAVAVVSLAPDHGIRFEGLAWPQGHPPAANCG